MLIWTVHPAGNCIPALHQELTNSTADSGSGFGFGPAAVATESSMVVAFATGSH